MKKNKLLKRGVNPHKNIVVSLFFCGDERRGLSAEMGTKMRYGFHSRDEKKERFEAHFED